MRNCVILFACLIVSLGAFAQENQGKKLMSYGIIAGVDYGYLKVENTDWEELGMTGEKNELYANSKVGFNIGIMCRFNISDKFAIVPQSILSFQSSELGYRLENYNDHEESVENVALEFPLHFVFTGTKGKKVNPSVFAGGKYSYDFSAKNALNKLDLKRSDFAIDLGTGVEINLNKFKLKPELIYSLGLINRKNGDDDIYNAAISSVNRDKISFRLVFYN